MNAVCIRTISATETLFVECFREKGEGLLFYFIGTTFGSRSTWQVKLTSSNSPNLADISGRGKTANFKQL